MSWWETKGYFYTHLNMQLESADVSSQKDCIIIILLSGSLSLRSRRTQSVSTMTQQGLFLRSPYLGFTLPNSSYLSLRELRITHCHAPVGPSRWGVVCEISQLTHRPVRPPYPMSELLTGRGWDLQFFLSSRPCRTCAVLRELLEVFSFYNLR